MLSERPFNLSHSHKSLLCISVSLIMCVCTAAASSLKLLVKHGRHSTMLLWSGKLFLEALTLHLHRNTSMPVLQEFKLSYILSSSLQPPATFFSQNSSLTAYHTLNVCILILPFRYILYLVWKQT